jgi:biotin-[acetyl-CoA-carboxylase] ligase BirA-like protein
MKTKSVIWLKETSSTMEDAEALLGEKDYLLVSAEVQTAGKGTRDRVWLSPPGNIFMTIGIHKRNLSGRQESLIPMEMGVVLHQSITKFINTGPSLKLHVQWPNDVLLEGRKICGILIKNARSHFLLGMGINVGTAPQVTDGGRESGCLSNYGMSPYRNKSLILEVFNRVKYRIEHNFPNKKTILQWKELVDWQSPVKLRSLPDFSLKPIDINEFGQFLVEFPDGSQKWLTADYLR